MFFISIVPAPDTCETIFGGYYVATTANLEQIVDYCRVRPYSEECQYELTCTGGGTIGYISNRTLVSPIFNVNGRIEYYDNGDPRVTWDSGFTYLVNKGTIVSLTTRSKPYFM